jgi:hypothetical protein
LVRAELMNRSHDYLFAQGDAHAVQQHQLHHFNAEIAQIDSNRLLNTNLDALVDYFVEKYRVEVPELDESGMQADQHEAQRDVSDDPYRLANIMGRTGPLYVTGTEVTVEIPFSGDAVPDCTITHFFRGTSIVKSGVSTLRACGFLRGINPGFISDTLSGTIMASVTPNPTTWPASLIPFATRSRLCRLQ